MKREGGHWRNNFELESENASRRFRAFVRYNDAFNENFSVGIDYVPADEPGTVPLLRCNGPHGGTKIHEHHNQTHIHSIDAQDINDGVKVLRVIEETNKYSSWEEALLYFFDRANISNAEEYFPTIKTKLPDIFKDLP
ncbi:MAG: hypothetical protein NUW37_11775 [Planctomycetes bacterium]|nr:hypothetical protein [Planctomycetota bacterium]